MALLCRRQLLVVTSGTRMVVMMVVVMSHLPAAAWGCLRLNATAAAATRDPGPPVSHALRLAWWLICCQVIGPVCAYCADRVDGDVGKACGEPGTEASASVRRAHTRLSGQCRGHTHLRLRSRACWLVRIAWAQRGAPNIGGVRLVSSWG